MTKKGIFRLTKRASVEVDMMSVKEDMIYFNKDDIEVLAKQFLVNTTLKCLILPILSF